MRTSNLEILRSPEIIVLAAGHGGSDSGATYDGFKESEQTIFITDEVGRILTGKMIDARIAPHGEDTDRTITWVNDNFSPGEAWVIELHRDSAHGLNFDDASRRCGIYHLPNRRSTEVGRFVQEAFIRYGAHRNSWARPDTQSNYGRLGWLRQTMPVAHLLELGFMQGRNDEQHLLWLADIASAVLYEAFMGRNYTLSIDDTITEEEYEERTLLDELAKSYKNTDIGDIFNRLNADVNPEHYDELKEVTLAQWILESGWATSRLAQEHYNFGGLKWRSEMEGFATRVSYQAHDGWDDYCKFENIDKFIFGYWRFIMRSPYRGWNQHTSEARDFINFLLSCGYTTSDTYEDTVIDRLMPRAIGLLSAA